MMNSNQTTPLSTKQLQEHKVDIRSMVWKELRKVAYPDSRFHYNFAEFIADFQGSDIAATQILESNFFAKAIDDTSKFKNSFIFITPDNCLEDLRLRLLNLKIPYLITTYSIRRGFYLVDPNKIDPNNYPLAATLDGMEKFAKHLSIYEMNDMNIKVPLMITGTGAINDKGIRFGKGHGFFDLEWAMLSTINAIDLKSTRCVAVVHDVQLLKGIELKPEIFDTVCDYVVTNSQIIHVPNAIKPTCGIIWDALAPGMLEDIEPLNELYNSPLRK